MTYIAQFSRRFPDLVCVCVCICSSFTLFLSLNQPFGSINKEHGELLRWLTDTRQRLTLVVEAPIKDMQTEYKVVTDFHVCLFRSLIDRENVRERERKNI